MPSSLLDIAPDRLMHTDAPLPRRSSAPEPRPLLVEMPLRVNGYDIDVMGIVHNLVYPRWFEDLRSRFLDLYWPLDGMLRDQQCPTILTTHVEYKAPLTIFDKPVGRLWLTEAGKARWKIAAEIATEQTIHCVGWQEGIVLDLQRRKPVRLPQHLLDKFQAELEQQAS